MYQTLKLSFLVGYAASAPRSKGQSFRCCAVASRLGSKPKDSKSCWTGIKAYDSPIRNAFQMSRLLKQLCKFVLICIVEMQLPGDLADPDSPAQVRLNAAVEKLNAESA